MIGLAVAVVLLGTAVALLWPCGWEAQCKRCGAKADVPALLHMLTAMMRHEREEHRR